MSYLLPDTTISTTASFNVQGIQDPLSDIDWVEFQNETSYSLAVQAGGYQFQIPAWTGWPVYTGYSSGFALPIQVTPKAILNYQATAPGSTLSVIIYRTGERPAHTAPYTLARQTNLGNSVPVGTQATQVINTGNSAPTAVLSGTPTGASSPEAIINNDGSATLGGGHVVMNAAGVFTSLPAGAVPGASISGAVPSATTATNATNATNATTAQNLVNMPTDVEGTPPVVIGRITPGDPFVLQTSDGVTSRNFTFGTDGSFALQYNQVRASGAALGPLTIGSSAPYVAVAGGGGFSSFYGISGSGSATVSIVMPLTPWAVLVNTDNGSNSTTFGSGSYTTTSVFVYQFNAQAWRGMVYV